MRKSIIRSASILFIFFFGISCEHELKPTCTEVVINVEVNKTDADPGKSNGTLSAIASGEGNYFTYSINEIDFQASNKFTGLDSGKYIVTAKNSWGCLGAQEVIIKKINPCTGVALTATVTNTTLGTSSGQIVAHLAGATGYTFSINSGAYQSSATFSGVAAGNYTVNAKNSMGCVFTAQATVGSTDLCAGVTVSVNATSVNQQ